MKHFVVAAVLTLTSSLSLAGFTCPGGRVDKWGHCEDYSPVGKSYYIDGLSSCLHPCSETEAQLLERAKTDAQIKADRNQNCGYRMRRTQEWLKASVQIVTEGTRVWSLATAGALFTCGY